jgi:hypothetical protein
VAGLFLLLNAVQLPNYTSAIGKSDSRALDRALSEAHLYQVARWRTAVEGQH